MREKFGCALIAAAMLLVWADRPAAGAPPDGYGPETCYIVADGTEDAVDGQAEDLLTEVKRSDHDPATNETDVGTGTGTRFVEAIALQPGTGILFATDAGTLGTIDLVTGRFTALGPVGAGDGALGELELDDIDGLSFDATTGHLYGSHRRDRGEDVLIRIDPASGDLVEGALEGGADYVVVPETEDLPDVDALAVDPLDGQMYAVINDNGRDDHLVKVDKLTGAVTVIGEMEAEDVEGLGFASGQLIGTTGKVHGEEGIWDIDKATGKASNRRPLDNGRDYESFDCLNAPNPLPPPPPAPLDACIEVTEDAIPDDPVDFPFATGGSPIPEGDFILDDDPASAVSNTVKHCNLAPGAYTVTQQTPVGWPLIDLDCTDPGGNSLVDRLTARASIDLAAGETVSCLFKNSPPVLETPREVQTVQPVVVTEPPAVVAGETATPLLPRTGRDGRPLVLASGLGLALGGLGVVGGTRRPRRRRPR